jgi:hypothetical protein
MLTLAKVASVNGRASNMMRIEHMEQEQMGSMLPAERRRALAIGAMALGAAAIGALAIGALAIGRLVIGKLMVRRGRFGALAVGELTVDRLRVRELIVEDEEDR